jgi:hypothetical protein
VPPVLAVREELHPSEQLTQTPHNPNRRAYPYNENNKYKRLAGVAKTKRARPAKIVLDLETKNNVVRQKHYRRRCQFNVGGNQFKKLEFPFEKLGFRHELIKRDGLVCLVRRTRIGYPNIPAHFEVVNLCQYPERILPDGKVLPASEAYPSSELWGECAFTYLTMDDALARFDSLRIRPAPERRLVRARYHTIARNGTASECEVAA